MTFIKHSWLVVAAVLLSFQGIAQEVPSVGENLAYLVTFGNKAQPKWGDDDFTQVFFMLIPENNTAPVYLRVYDPDVGGKVDQPNRDFNTKTKFAVYGGSGCHSEKDARWIDPKGNYKSGNMLASKIFGSDSQYDDAWYSFGPFNPSEGEYNEDFHGYIFKIVCEGVTGDDGNLYKYFLSTRPNTNTPLEGGNMFTYEYAFRLVSRPVSVAHLYPFVDDKVVSVTQNNFDFDADGIIRIYSIAKNGHDVSTSSDNTWARSTHQIDELECGRSLDLRIMKRAAFDNDMTLYITNQYNEPLPFFAVPLGGPPKYRYKMKINLFNKDD